MNNSIEWDVIENKTNDIKDILDKVIVLEDQNNKFLSNIDSLKYQNQDLNNKIDFCSEKIDNLEKLIKLFIIDNKKEIISIDEEESEDEEKKNTQVDLNFPPYDLSNNYINRMTNRLWRNSSYTTTPNFLFTNLNKN